MTNSGSSSRRSIRNESLDEVEAQKQHAMMAAADGGGQQEDAASNSS